MPWSPLPGYSRLRTEKVSLTTGLSRKHTTYLQRVDKHHLKTRVAPVLSGSRFSQAIFSRKPRSSGRAVSLQRGDGRDHENLEGKYLYSREYMVRQTDSTVKTACAASVVNGGLFCCAAFRIAGQVFHRIAQQKRRKCIVTHRCQRPSRLIANGMNAPRRIMTFIYSLSFSLVRITHFILCYACHVLPSCCRVFLLKGTVLLANIQIISVRRSLRSI